MAIRIRRNVFDLGAWSTELIWYARAVEALLTRPLNDPTSWRYVAAVHGRMSGADPYAAPGDAIPPNAAEYWDQCQHQTWFFLPWHRAYLAAFEALVATTIESLGGPADWALPYWDYSATAASRLMPRDFYEEFRPDGSPNALWNRWGRPANGDAGFTDEVVSLECLTHELFAGSNDGADPGFGGPITGFMHFGQQVNLPSGWVEDVPHNVVHGQIGGLMGHPDYAALDPIFWLHHANIDRLWEVYRRTWPAQANPGDVSWLSAVRFELHDGMGRPFTCVAADMLDTRSVLHGYEYDSRGLPAIAHPHAMTSEMAKQPPRTPEMVGANDVAVSLAGGVASTLVPIRATPPRLRSLVSANVPLRAYLNLEHITGTGAPGNYEVYLQAGDQPPTLAGIMSTFGIEKASSVRNGHGGNGLDRVLEITKLIQRLGLDGAREQNLRVTFKQLAQAARRDPPPFETSGSEVVVGRVSLYFA